MTVTTNKIIFDTSILPSLSACMIVKNEENILGKLLEEIKDIVDEIIIVDTGSTDKTIKIASKYTKNIYHYKWDNNFSNARNESLKYATKDYIIWLDADDRVNKQDLLKLKLHLKSNPNTAVFLTLIDVRLNKEFKSMQLRVFPNNKNLKFRGRVHEQISFSVEEQKIQYTYLNIPIYHIGYDTEKNIQNKLLRNAKILEEDIKENPNDFMTILSLSRTYLGLNKIKKASVYINKAFKLAKQDNVGVSKDNRFLAYLGKITLLSMENKIDEVISILENAKSIFPDNKLLRVTLGEIYFRNKNYENAYKELLTIRDGKFNLSLNPIDVTGMMKTLQLFLLISALYVGDFRTATNCIRNSINDPNFKIKNEI